uniref:Uncharacterized protein n=1 Tax=Rhizophora mucronata TaxID=61149 RepID=A0A2P2QHZ5_RHIMU
MDGEDEKQRKRKEISVAIRKLYTNLNKSRRN